MSNLIKQAVILAGGKGSRLKEINGVVPKILTKVGAITVMEDQILQLQLLGIKRVLYLLGHGNEEILIVAEALKQKHEIEIDFILEKEELGTGGALVNASRQGKIDDEFLLLQGDVIFRTDLSKFLNSFDKTNCDVLIMVHPSSHMFDSDLVEVREDFRVVKIHSKPRTELPLIRNLSNAGIYIISKKVLSSLSHTKEDLDRELIPKLLLKNALIYAFRNTGFVRDMGTPQRLTEVRHFLSKFEKHCNKPALFIDRDGTINIEKGYLKGYEELELYEDAIELIKLCNQSKIWVFVVTNQPVIARGEATFADIDKIHFKLDALLGEYGAYVDDYFICPHHPDKGYPGEISKLKFVCDCRKPESGLVKEALIKYEVDLSKSFVVGDSWRDYQLGYNLGLTTYLVDRTQISPNLPIVNSLRSISLTN